MKNRKFSNTSRNHKIQDVKIKLCNDSTIFVLFRKEILKRMEVPDFWKGTDGKTRLNVKKWSISHGLSREFFQKVPDTLEHSILHLF